MNSSLERVGRDRQRLKELREIEARLEREAEPTWLSDYAKVAKARAELEALRAVIALCPPDVEELPAEAAPEDEGGARASRVYALRSAVESNRRSAEAARRSLASVEAKLAGPVDLRDYKPPRFNPAQNPVDAEAALNRAYAAHCERFRGPLRDERARLLTRIEECEAEAGRAEEELREMGEAL